MGKRQDILQATLELLEEFDGKKDITLENIRQKAGLSPGGFQYYFANKTELIVALFDSYTVHIEKDILQRFREISSRKMAKQELIYFAVEVLVEEQKKHRHFSTAMQHLSRNIEILQQKRQVLEQKQIQLAATLLYPLFNDRLEYDDFLKKVTIATLLLLKAGYIWDFEDIEISTDDQSIQISKQEIVREIANAISRILEP